MGAEQVLEGLRETDGGFCSGQALSRRLGVSRAQVWKHIESLRERGYAIEGEAGGGYRLTSIPDRLYASEVQRGLQTRELAQNLVYFEEIDSTNRFVFDEGRRGAPAGTTAIAESQSAGRGRLGRSFHSPAHLNLYTSILLRPALSTVEAPTLVHAAAVGCANAIAAFVPDPSHVEIKWPNDILLGGRKTCGILMESHAEATRLEFAVVGIGVNLNIDRNDFPDEFRSRATSLRSHTGKPIDRIPFARALFEALEASFDRHASGGFAAIRPAYEARFRMRGKSVRITDLGGAERDGRVLGIADDGSLRLARADGREECVIAGDVTLSKEGAPHG